MKYDLKKDIKVASQNMEVTTNLGLKHATYLGLRKEKSFKNLFLYTHEIIVESDLFFLG